MKPRLIPDARRVALRAYSMWANYLGLACLIFPEILFVGWQIDTNPRLWWGLGLGLLLASTIGRLIDQRGGRLKSSGAVMIAALFLMGMGQAPEPSPPDPAPPAAVAAPGPVTLAEFEAIAVPLIAKWEGKRNAAYRDLVGVWTICYGHTRSARPGMRLSDAQCLDLLRAEVVEYREGLHRYLSQTTRRARLTPARDAAYVSLAYNVGISGAGKSTAVRRLNAGDIAGGCEALTWWNKAGGRVVRGLARRRAEESALCLRGLAS